MLFLDTKFKHMKTTSHPGKRFFRDLYLWPPLFFFMLYSLCGYAQQGVSINTSGAPADSSAMLDVSSASKGLLIPRVSLASINDLSTITNPAVSLLVYNTNAAMAGGAIGFWYFDGTVWVQALGPQGPPGADGSADAWSLTGNAGTFPWVNFIGTTDSSDLSVKTNNILRSRFTRKGQIEIFNTGESVFLGEEAGKSDDLTNNQNVFIGYKAGNKNTTGHENTAMGHQSLFNNTVGNYNTAVGYQTLWFNSAGSLNTAMGENVLYHNTTGNSNTAIGFDALYQNTSGSDNVAVGKNVLFSNTTGGNNVGIGGDALSSNSTGSSNTAVGRFALQSNTSGYSNMAAGDFALNANTTGYRNTASGSSSLYSNTTGHENTAGGFWSLYSNTEGNWNTANGYASLYWNIAGSYNTAGGGNALNYNTTGSYNVAYGMQALMNNVAGSRATAVGFSAMLNANNTADLFENHSVAMGYEALRGSASAAANTGNNNTAVGYQTLLSNSTGNNNTALGDQALNSNTTAYSNTGLGRYALKNTSTGSQNTAVGQSAMLSNSNGYLNVALGDGSLLSNSTGYSNTGAGTSVLYHNLSGNNNTALGFESGFNSTGSGNVFLGNQAGYNETGSNKLYIANSSTNPPLIFGDFSVGKIGLGTISPAQRLDVQGGNINTSANLMTGGTARVDASGNLINIGNITATGASIYTSGAGTLLALHGGNSSTAAGGAVAISAGTGVSGAAGSDVSVNAADASGIATGGKITLTGGTGGYFGGSGAYVSINGGAPNYGPGGNLILSGGLQGPGNTWDPNRNGSVILAINGAEYMRLDGYRDGYQGFVGIGTSTPSTKLDVNGVITATGGNSTQWNNAFGWGNHAAAGYLTTETDGSVTNELQVLTISNDTIFLTNGGYVKLPAGFDGQYSSLTGVPTNVSTFTNDAGYLTSLSETDPQVGTNTTNYHSRWDGSALVTSSVYDNGNVGIGTTITDARLQIKPTAEAGYTLRLLSQSYDDRYVSIWRGTDGGVIDVVGPAVNPPVHLGFYIAGSEKVRITNAGYVGIGTPTPNSLLHVSNSSNTLLQVGDSALLSGSDNNTGAGSAGSVTITGGSDLMGTGTSAGSLTLRAGAWGGTDRAKIVIKSVGIGGTGGGIMISGGYNTAGTISVGRRIYNGSPAGAVVITGGEGASNGNGGSVTLAAGAGSGDVSYRGGDVFIKAGAGISPSPPGNILFKIADVSVAKIDSTGKIGIGTTHPGAKLEVNGTVKITDGTQGSGKVLTSDADGLASWNSITGAETKVTAGTNVSVTGTGTTSDPYVISSGSSSHYIGESYGGGIVFYVYDNGQHGLIAATSDQSTAIKFGYNAVFTMAFADGLYAGRSNTNLVIAGQSIDDGTSYAARLCNEYTATMGGVTYGDWYLPSKHELNLLYQQRVIVGGFSTNNYWASNEYVTNMQHAWYQNFGTGNQNIDNKVATACVRAIRAF
mgnify:CR=1 FL=1